MNETDHPKYLALVGELGIIQETELLEAIDFERLRLLHGADYPTISTEANRAFLNMKEVEDDPTVLGTDLYIRLRDVEPLIKAAREVGPLESFTALDEALAKLEDIP